MSQAMALTTVYSCLMMAVSLASSSGPVKPSIPGLGV